MIRSAALVSVVALGLLIPACSGSGGGASLAARVRAWTESSDFSGTGATLADDIHRIHTATQRRDLIGLQTECEVFVADVRTALGYLPTPDGDLTGELSRSYDDFARSASECYEGVSSRSQAKLESAARLLRSGQQNLTKAEATISDLTSP